MTVFHDKSRGRWRYDFVAGGIRHARECVDAAGQPVTSRRAAVDAEAEAKRQAKMAPKLPTAADLTLAEALNAVAESWVTDSERSKKGRMARELLAYAGAAKPIREMDGAWVQDYISHLMKTPVMVWHGGAGRQMDDPKAAQFWKPAKGGRTRTTSTVNRHLPLLRAVFTRAYKTRDPITRERAIEEIPVVKDLPEPKRKARPTPEPVLQRLQVILPRHVIDALVITLCFGFRSGEAFGLVEHQIDWAAGGVRFFSETVKNDEDAFQPGSQYAMGYLRCLAMEADTRRDAKGKTIRHLISYRREPKLGGPDRPWRPIKSPRTAWRTAMKKIEAEFGRRWRWHDLRAAFITDVAMNSGHMAAQKLARHANFDTTRGYIEVADEMLRAAAERVSERPALGLIAGGKK